MSRKIIMTGVAILIALIVSMFVAYAQPLRNSLFARQVEPTSSVNSIVASAGLQAANGNGVRVSNLASLTLQPDALKLAKRIGNERFKSRTGLTLVMQAVLKTDGDSQQVTIIRRQTDDGEQMEVTLDGGRGSLAWARESGGQRSVVDH